MLDFFTIREREGGTIRKPLTEVFPDFKIVRSKDLMIRGKQFYAIWDDKAQLWSTDEFDVQRLVDQELKAYETQVKIYEVHRKLLGNFSSSSWMQFRNYIGHLTNNSHQLDENLTFANSEVKKEDYVSKRLSYPLTPGDISAYDELMSVLYDPEQRAKLEWAIGAVMSGDSKHIQKFFVLYGGPGTGKSTWLQILQWLTEGYYVTFEAAAITSNNNMFSMEVFRDNPLVAIQHDGDLSKIADNSKLNSIVAHEPMTINEKNKPSFTDFINAMLFLGTNKPVKITDAKSGMGRRLIDVHPTGDKIPPRKYQAIMAKIPFELGAIASHCLEVYRSMGKDYYSMYIPIDMMLQTDVFFNFIEAFYDTFSNNGGTTLRGSYNLYKEYCKDTNIEYVMPQYKFREEMKNYFTNFDDRAEINGERVRSWYSGFIADKFKSQKSIEEPAVFSLVMDEDESLLDKRYADNPAQYANADGTPSKPWDDVTTTLKDLDTSKEHYVLVDEQEITIDFDLKDGNGVKSVEMNLEAASKWPSTYAEFSKSEAGIHLQYEYEGDVSELSRVYDHGIEIKVFTGKSSLRRKFSKGNNIPVAKISSGLPLKEKKVISSEGLKSEKALRDLIERNLRKEIHPGTKSSTDFIVKILDDAYASGLSYDVTDMKSKILAFAANSTNQALPSIKNVQLMKFASEVIVEAELEASEDPFVFFDCEVFKNLFVLNWKFAGDTKVVRMINPSPQAVEELFKYKLIGFNNRRYDNHILYAASMGLNNMELYKLSKKIIDKVPNAFFGAAFNLSYTDIFDFASANNKKSLKRWQIDLDIQHIELGLDWDQPVPEELWEKVAAYCDNDVISTEVVFNHLKSDWKARQMLAVLSGLTPNDTTNKHSTRIMFGDDRNPQEKFNYTHLDEMFHGYVYEMGKSTYRGEITGEGGYVYSEPGMYYNVVELDAESMHPTSIEQMDVFGEYTKIFSEIKQARVFIKHGDFDTARKMMDGKLAPFLDDEEDAKGVSDALKTVINSVYGLTSATFDNAFKDPRNIDNIVAKRGALFMIDLKHAVQEKGYQVVHIKTDSIKIPNADKKIIEFVMEFASGYGYNFVHEATYEKLCLVNDAVYIAKTEKTTKPSYWTATGAQFAHPYVFKTLFSKEKITFKDKCEPKAVQSAIYLDFTDVEEAMALSQDRKHFVGKAGLFCPVTAEGGGAILEREKDGKFYAVTGTKGYRWLEAEMVKELGKEKYIDESYFGKLVDSAIKNISQYGDFEAFVA